MYLNIENVSTINQYASKCFRERGKKKPNAFVVYV